MKLGKYLFKKKYSEENVSLKKFAEALEITSPHITNYLKKRTRISKKIARHIERLTNGEVTANEILNDNPPKKSMK